MRFKLWVEAEQFVLPDHPHYDLEEIPQQYHQHYQLPRGRWFWLSKVYVPPQMRGTGMGKKIVKEAQSKVPPGAGILLKLDPFGDKPMSTDDLWLFYSSLGFSPWHGVNSDDYMYWVNRG